VSTILYIAGMVLIAFAIGAIARFILPGKDEISFLGTMMLGFAGSVGGGIIALIIFGGVNGAGLIGSVLFAALLLYVVRKLNGGGLRDPGEV
jgi:uncharacterized membrane protein YeaQ/YmgE (transglycosylase-associated protein family)